jgi:opacity protein-like surface antigen
MKTFLICFFLLVSIVHAQEEIIIGAPLSVEDEPGRTLKQDQPIGTLIPVKANINPVDGQLKLEPIPVTKEDEKKQEEVSEIIIEQRYERPFVPQKYIQFSFGYLGSDWDKADPSLDNGSTLTTFNIASDMNKNVQVGFAVELIHDNSDQNIPDNIRVLQYRLSANYHGPIFEDKLHWIAGLAASIGDYSISKLSLNTLGQEVRTKISEGIIFGLIPSAGIRFYLVDQNSIDLSLEYHQYFSKPQSYIGGFALVPRFCFAF